LVTLDLGRVGGQNGYKWERPSDHQTTIAGGKNGYAHLAATEQPKRRMETAEHTAYCTAACTSLDRSFVSDTLLHAEADKLLQGLQLCRVNEVELLHEIYEVFK